MSMYESICTNRGLGFVQPIASSIIDDMAKKAVDFANGAKNVVRFSDGNVIVTYPDTSNCIRITSVMPNIIDVKTISNVVIVSFADGTSEKAVLSPDDVYSLEYGISICVTKKLFSDKFDGNGSSIYNKIVHHGMKVYENNRKQAEKNTREAQRIKEKVEKLAKKKSEKKAKREAAERERLVEIQKEAYLRAMREFNKDITVCLDHTDNTD